MKVRGAVLRETGRSAPYAESKPLSIEALTLASPAAGELLVRVLAAGLCHSDLSVIDGSRPRPLPMVLGHEATGKVVELGAGVCDFTVGDRVVFSFVPMCGHCAPCAESRPALCEPGAAANTRGELLGGGRCVMFRAYIALYRAGRLPVDRLLSRTLALDEINEGFDRLARGEAIWQVVVFEG